MRTVFRTGLTFVAGGAALVALDAVSKRQGSRAARMRRALLAFVRPSPVPDDTAVGRVRARLARVASDPEAIRVAGIEHGCVELRGAVPTRERARIVKEVASVQGVDSVVDLMTEPRLASPAAREGEAGAALDPETGLPALARPMWTWPFPRSEWSPAARIIAVGSGLGLTSAALGIGSRLVAIPAAVVGIVLLASGASARTRRREAALPGSGPVALT